jgi:glyceraldehyde-3-phosphate dehydrogenase/erythrose-4-phosphate dehydrogenase
MTGRGAATRILAPTKEDEMPTRIAIADAETCARLLGQVKVVAWYDDEWGYANRLVDLAERVLAPVPVAA